MNSFIKITGLLCGNKQHPFFTAKAILMRPCHTETSTIKPIEIPLKKFNASNVSLDDKFEIFNDKNAPIIFDINEEREKLQQQIANETTNAYEGLNLERGQTGVFEIDDLVEVLRRRNAENIFVCNVPKNIKYVDYICITSGWSHRHRKAMAQFIRKLFKMKRHSMDILPKIEGENSVDWMAMDLGNIALHIFSPEARQKYNLETLWTVGSVYDDECNKPVDPLLELFQRHTMYLGDLIPKNK